MLNNCTLKESRTWLLVCTRHCYFIPLNHEHPVEKVRQINMFYRVYDVYRVFDDCIVYWYTQC